MDPRFRVDYLADKENTLLQLKDEAVDVLVRLESSTDSTPATPPPAKKKKGLHVLQPDWSEW